MNRTSIVLLSAFSLCHAAAAQLTLVTDLRDARSLTGAHDIEIRDGLAYVAGKGFTTRALPLGGQL